MSNWFQELPTTQKAVLSIVTTATIAFGLGVGASATWLGLPSKVELNTAAIVANSVRWDSVSAQLDVIETGLVMHLCESNGNHTRPLSSCMAETRRTLNAVRR